MKINNFVTVFFILLILFFISEIIITLTGYGKAAFFLFFPIFYSTSPIALIPLIFIFMMFILPFLMFYRGQENYNYDIPDYGNEVLAETKQEIKGSSESSFGGFLLIGPVPIIFGKNMDRRILYLLMGITIIFMVIYLLLFLNL
jgi:Protein of unknown function DUF131.